MAGTRRVTGCSKAGKGPANATLAVMEANGNRFIQLLKLGLTNHGTNLSGPGLDERSWS